MQFWGLGRNVKNIFAEHNIFEVGLRDLTDLESYRNSIKKDIAALQYTIDNNLHGNMKFLEKNHEARVNPQLILSEVKSALIVAIPYELSSNNICIASYAQSEEYHGFLKHKLTAIAEQLAMGAPYRIVIDSIPFFEKANASLAGIGYVGKNTLLQNNSVGSACVLGSIFFTQPATEFGTLSEINNVENKCENCNLCITSCPTKALSPYLLNAPSCLSYLSIEHRGLIDKRFLPYFADVLFGCDKCVRCCPSNLHRNIAANTALLKSNKIIELTPQWVSMSTIEAINAVIKNTALARIGGLGLKRNALYSLYASSDKILSEMLMYNRKLKNDFLTSVCETLL